MNRTAYVGEDLVVVAKATTGSTLYLAHTLPNQTFVVDPTDTGATQLQMTENGTTGNFYYTFNNATAGTHLLRIMSVGPHSGTADAQVDGLTMSIVNRLVSNTDINTALTTVDGIVDEIKTDVDGVVTSVATIDSNVDSVVTSVGTIDSNVDSVVTALTTVDGIVDEIKTDVDSVVTTLSGIDTQVDSIEAKIDNINSDVDSTAGWL